MFALFLEQRFTLEPEHKDHLPLNASFYILVLKPVVSTSLARGGGGGGGINLPARSLTGGYLIKSALN